MKKEEPILTDIDLLKSIYVNNLLETDRITAFKEAVQAVFYFQINQDKVTDMDKIREWLND